MSLSLKEWIEAIGLIGVPVAGVVLNWLSKARHLELRELIETLIEPHGLELNRHHERIASLERAVRPWEYEKTPTNGGKPT